jgi:hypothetical protein
MNEECLSLIDEFPAVKKYYENLNNVFKDYLKKRPASVF